MSGPAGAAEPAAIPGILAVTDSSAGHGGRYGRGQVGSRPGTTELAVDGCYENVTSRLRTTVDLGNVNANTTGDGLGPAGGTGSWEGKKL